jgi:hypothetical protein
MARRSAYVRRKKEVPVNEARDAAFAAAEIQTIRSRATAKQISRACDKWLMARGLMSGTGWKGRVFVSGPNHRTVEQRRMEGVTR